MISSRITLGLGALLLGGVALAAITPVLPFQEPTQSTEHHERVLEGAGEWEGTLSMPIPGMDEPMAFPCSESVATVGELWTTGRFEGDFGGMKFVGVSTLGYDSIAKKYVGTWIDNVSPVMAIMEGQYDKEKKAIVMHYDMYDTETKSTKRMRSETIHDGDSYTIEFFDASDADGATYMKISMKKKAAAAGGR